MSELIGFNEPFISRDRIVDKDRYPTTEFVTWMEQSLLKRVQSTPFQMQSATPITNIGASTIGTLGGDSVAGLYRVTVYREVTTADPVSSGLDIVLAWSHNGKALTRTLTAFAGVPQTINDSVGDTAIIQIDAGTPITYTVVYASAGGVARFAATLTAELVQAIG